MNFSINHFNINVTDLKKSIEFYKKHLGLNFCREIIDPDGEYHIVYLSDKNNMVFIELTWIKSKVGKYNLGDNEFHIAFTTNDYESAYKKHKESGVVVFENKEMGIYFIVDPDGYWLEILPENKK